MKKLRTPGALGRISTEPASATKAPMPASLKLNDVALARLRVEETGSVANIPVKSPVPLTKPNVAGTRVNRLVEPSAVVVLVAAWIAREPPVKAIAACDVPLARIRAVPATAAKVSFLNMLVSPKFGPLKRGPGVLTETMQAPCQRGSF